MYNEIFILYVGIDLLNRLGATPIATFGQILARLYGRVLRCRGYFARHTAVSRNRLQAVIVPTGSLDPDAIHLPGVYVQRLIVGAPYDKKIEFRTMREREAA